MIIVILILLGLCMGSFVNALVFRLFMQSKKSSVNRQQITDNRQHTADSRQQNTDYSIVRGRSMCVNCHHTLAWYDLIPVLSWLGLRGKCRYCKKKISWQYPLVELLTAVLFVLSYTYFPFHVPTSSFYTLLTLWLVILTLFIAMFVYDLKWMILPDKLTYSFLFFAILSVIYKIIWLNEDVGGTMGAAFWGLLCLGGLFYLIFQVSGGKWIGGGDVKLGFGLGILVGGPVLALTTLFFASLIGTVIAVTLMLLRKDWRRRRIPFGPLLLTAAFFVYIFSSQISEIIESYFLI